MEVDTIKCMNEMFTWYVSVSSVFETKWNGKSISIVETVYGVLEFRCSYFDYV